VIERGAMCEVFAGGLLLGQYEREGRDRGARNMLLVTLAQQPQMHLGQLAQAFEVSEEYLRILRRKTEAGGLGAGLSGIALTARPAPAQDGVRTAVLLGILLLNEPATSGRLASIGLILAGIVGLRLVTPE
jgi:quaternary ammonium compound-resistance protein SugE